MYFSPLPSYPAFASFARGVFGVNEKDDMTAGKKGIESIKNVIFVPDKDKEPEVRKTILNNLINYNYF